MKEKLKKIRTLGTFYLPEQTLDHLKKIRSDELKTALQFFPPRGAVLEIGAGTGWQALALKDMGYDVDAIDLAISNLKGARIYPVLDYDGEKIPFEDNRFDVVFSSNVFEHIPHIDELQCEIQRVLKPGGRMVCILPSSSWRFWDMFSSMVRWWHLPSSHGEHAKNAFVEIYYFRRGWWKRIFSRTGWHIEDLKSNDLFYTGAALMDGRWGIGWRKKLSRFLGGSCNIFYLRYFKG